MLAIPKLGTSVLLNEIHPVSQIIPGSNVCIDEYGFDRSTNR